MIFPEGTYNILFQRTGVRTKRLNQDIIQNPNQLLLALSTAW